MDCEQFAVFVHELTRPELAPGDARGSYARLAALEHARACPMCSARLAEAQKLAQALDAIAQESKDAEAPAHLEASLVAAFRQYLRGVQGEEYRQRRLRLRWVEWAALGAVAAVLLVAGIWNYARPHGNTLGNTASVAANMASPAPAWPPGAKHARKATAPGNTAVTSGAGRVEEAAASQSDLTSGFLPVPYGGDFEAGNSGVVVRVEIPRAALADLGYPVYEANSADVVQADVVVGEDGWPRAIRLVDQSASSTGGSR